MKVTVTKLSTVEDMRWACECTLPPGKRSRTTLFAMYRAEHSPIRTQRFRIHLTELKSFVSVHLARHHVGIEGPFVRTNRADRGGAGNAAVTRDAPVTHGVEMNAASLINVSRKRLCLQADPETVAAWSRVRKAVREVDPDLYWFLVPECCYRGFCPEPNQCGAGVRAVVLAYATDNPAYCFRLGQLEGMPEAAHG